jgi:hypothetical protein
MDEINSKFYATKPVLCLASNNVSGPVSRMYGKRSLCMACLTEENQSRYQRNAFRIVGLGDTPRAGRNADGPQVLA